MTLLRGIRDNPVTARGAALLLCVFSVLLVMPAVAQTIDDFNRSDSSSVGNGWIEKNPAAFALNAGAVEKQQVGSSYRNNIVFRPASENLQNVETSVEFRLSYLSPRYPQVFARVQTGTALTADVLDAYILYVSDSTTDAVLGRQEGGNFVVSLANIAISPALNVNDTFRLRLSVSGTDPVDIVASVDRFNGGGWDVIGQATVADTSPQRIVGAGSVGFGGSSTEDQYTYDNFVRVDLDGGGGGNPVPVVTSMTPVSAEEGSGAFTLTVSGSDFVASSVVRWDGQDRPTTYVSASQLTAAIAAADVATAGTATVTVATPGPGGGVSTGQTFTIDPLIINNPLPVLTGIVPANADEGSGAFTLTVLGSDFVASSVVRWDGVDRPTTFVSANELSAAIGAADVAAAGTATVTVASPAPGGGVSGGQTFTIDPVAAPNPAPVLTNILPANADEGSGAFTLTAQGTDFVASSVVRWNGQDRATTYVSANELAATITAADVATAGTATVTVATPAPGGGVSAGRTFTIDPVASNDPPPFLTGILPSSADEGSGAFTLTAQGADFVASSVVRWNGQDRPTTFVSSGQLTAAIGAADIAMAGTAAVTVFTPAPGGGLSGTATFTINASTPGNPQFVDDFNRSDSSNVGNGWIEKSPAAFALNAGAVEKAQVGSSYWDNIVFRPASENLQDVEASVEFRLANLSPRYPQIFARVQTATALTGGYLDAYILYVSDSATDAVLGRQDGSNFVTSLASIGIAPALNTTDNFRLRLSVTGTDPVNIVASIDRFNGTGWDVIGQAPVADSAPQRITSAGSVGFGGSSAEDQYTYDNFTRTDLGGGSGSNPQPQLTSVSPSAATAGDPAFTLTVNGSDFVSSSVVRWNGQDRATTYVSANQLTAAIGAADIATAGTANIAVSTPTPGGGVSASQTFTIDPGVVNNPLPVLTGLLPANADEGSGAFTLTALGSDFIAASVVRWNGQDRATTYVSPNELGAQISAADIATAGTATVTVATPAPGGGVSGPATFTIDPVAVNNPLPVLTSIAPTNAIAGDPTFSLNVFGSDFVDTSVVRWNGQDRATTYVSPNALVAQISAADVAAAGTATVTVASPAPGGGVSASAIFTVFPPGGPNPVPYVSGIWPVVAEEGSGPLTMTVWGGDFGDFSTVLFGGQPRTTYFSNPGELQVQLLAGDVAVAGFYNIQVENPGPGGGQSNALAFEVTASSGNSYVPGLTDLSPGSWPVDGGALLVDVSGSNFTSATEVRWNGVARPTVFIDAQSLQASLPASDFTSAQNAAVSVWTAGPGGGSSDPQTFFVYDPATAFFYDNFNRLDSATLGNGWTEKNPAAFSLFAGELVSTTTTDDYRDNIVHRPISEDRLDVEVSIEFTRGLVNENLPQLHARVQRDTIGTTNSLESYLYFINDVAGEAVEAAIAIQPPFEQAECFIGVVPLPSALQFEERYRLRFRVAGTSVVDLTGFVDHWNGQTWDVFASGSVSHDINTQPPPGMFCGPGYMPPPIDTAGSTGAAKYRNRTDPYDNFYWQDYVANPGLNPAPLLNSLSPGSATTGDPDLTLIVDGANFIASSVVRWDGADRQTTFVSPNQLTALIPAQDFAQATVASVTVFSPGPGGGESAAQGFVVQDSGSGGTGGIIDDFERPDSAALGNGWIEKNAAAFSLSNGAAVKQGVATGYRDNIVYRPATEDILNVETSMEFRLFSLAPGYPQLFARVQSATAGTAGQLDGYILYINNSSGDAVLGRQRADNFVAPLANVTISPGLNATDLYRMSLRAEGTAAVDLTATFERWTGTAWIVIGQASATDTAPDRVATPGSVGFGGYIEANYSFDNFAVTDLDQ